jgi:hypothetical protein
MSGFGALSGVPSPAKEKWSTKTTKIRSVEGREEQKESVIEQPGKGFSCWNKRTPSPSSFWTGFLHSNVP